MNFHTERARTLQRRLDRVAIANARRVTCPRCGLSVADLARHVYLTHEDVA